MAEAKKTTKVSKEVKKDKTVKKVKKVLDAAAPKAEFTSIKFNWCLIAKKRSGRFQVFAKNGKNVNGAEKTKILRKINCKTSTIFVVRWKVDLMQICFAFLG